MKEELLLNCEKLAEAIGRSVNYITAMRRAGYVFQYPGRTTLKHALKWLSENPYFVASHWQTPEKTAELKRARKAVRARRAR